MPAPINVNQTVQTECGQQFKTISKHRNGRLNDVSKWLISIPEEYECFKDALAATGHAPTRYSELTICWGYMQNNNSLVTLGHNIHTPEIKIAKFTKHVNNTEWHGYPADYAYKPQDIPPSKWLTMLVSRSLLSKPNISKILQGKKCNL